MIFSGRKVKDRKKSKIVHTSGESVKNQKIENFENRSHFSGMIKRVSPTSNNDPWGVEGLDFQAKKSPVEPPVQFAEDELLASSESATQWRPCFETFPLGTLLYSGDCNRSGGI